MLIQALPTLLNIARAGLQEVPALVAQLEQQAAESVLVIEQNINATPREIIARLVERYPLLASLEAHPQAEQVITKIVKVLKERPKK